MKKSILAIACCIGLMLFASCKKDPVAPTITAIQDEGYVAENAQIYVGDEIKFGFAATGEKLTQLEITLTESGNVLSRYSESAGEQANFSFTQTSTVDVIGTITITGTITDAAGQTATKSYNIICGEKPNAKFVGHYEGDILITGSYEANITGMDPIANDLDNMPLPTIVDIAAGDNINEVTATITIKEQSNTVKGNVEGNKVVFEAINSTFNYNYQYQGFSIPIPLTMTYSINGTLNGEQLELDGDCNGNGEINLALFNINGTFALDGTIGGSLNKTR